MPKIDKPEEKSESESDDDDENDEVEDKNETDETEVIETKPSTPPTDNATTDGDGEKLSEPEPKGDTQETGEAENVCGPSIDKDVAEVKNDV